MKTLNASTIVSLVVLLSALLACKASEGNIKKLESIKTAACACTNKTCADKQLAEFKTLVQKIKNKRVSEDQKNRIASATKDLTICLLKQGESVSDIKAATK